MEPVSEALALLRRQEEIEAAMKQPGGIRITEERDLLALRARLKDFPVAVRAILTAAHSLRKPVSELTLDNVENLAQRERRLAG